MLRQIVVISGKGGTGKTVLTASFATLAKNKVMVDCDVDAADLYLLLHPKILEKHDFIGGKTASLNIDKCVQCNECVKVCRFDAIKKNGKTVIIDPISCEGCGLCSYVCPASAIRMEENISGKWFISDTKYGPFVHAKLGIAEDNSGKLVAKIRQEAKNIAEKEHLDYIIIDGPPGIGCPVIASLSGVNCALIVTEPTLSGMHDAERVMEVVRHFKIPVKLVINKYDLNISLTEQIEAFCKEKKVPVIGKIGFDKAVVESIVRGKTVVEYADGGIKNEIIKIWETIQS